MVQGKGKSLYMACITSLPGTLTNMKKVNQTKYVHGASNSNGTEIKSVVLEGHIAGERER